MLLETSAIKCPCEVDLYLVAIDKVQPLLGLKKNTLITVFTCNKTLTLDYTVHPIQTLIKKL